LAVKLTMQSAFAGGKNCRSRAPNTVVANDVP
jgi:hypothetical protein